MDTHTLVWLTESNKQLGKQAKSLIHQALNERQLFVSAISFWEVALLCQKQRIYLEILVSDWRHKLLANGLQEIPLTGDIAVLSTQLSDFHADPADRFITATALSYDAMLITADNLILNWNGQLQRHNAKL
ncbi:Toxin of toxin-antitoxin (TA) system [Beggiatoa sp. PS]|nr:Toxin of toxin-antitoxin (TA) system [Beggiatoa sp. PS]